MSRAIDLCVAPRPHYHRIEYFSSLDGTPSYGYLE